MTKKYSYHDDFNSLAKLKVDFSKGWQIRAINIGSRIQNHFNSKRSEVNSRIMELKGFNNLPFKVEILEPQEKQSKPLPCIVYLHGGGFLTDVSPQHIYQCVEYVKRLNCRVIMPYYHLALNHPFPAGFEDCWKTLTWLVDQSNELQIDIEKIVLAGDSAGGCLAAGLAQKIRDTNLLNLKLQLLVYPVLDHSMTTDSAINYTDTPIWNANNNKAMWETYLRDHETAPPYASPMQLESFVGLAAAYIEPAEFDCLRDEGMLYAKKLQEAGVQITLNPTKETFHCFDMNTESRITQKAIEDRTNALRNAFS